MTSFYNAEELREIGFAHVGEGTLISRKASIYGAEHMRLGDHVRVDDFCILSGKIILHDYIHIAAYCGLYGGSAGIEIRDFSATSSGVRIYAVSDDYSGAAMVNPMVPDQYRNVMEEPVLLGKHVIVGSGTVILPGVQMGEGCSVGAMSLVVRPLPSWSIYAGIPVKKIRERKKDILELEERFLQKRNEETGKSIP